MRPALPIGAKQGLTGTYTSASIVSYVVHAHTRLRENTKYVPLSLSSFIKRGAQEFQIVSISDVTDGLTTGPWPPLFFAGTWYSGCTRPGKG
jgi:hypothetical protein